jgi:hypothetical protein
MNIKPKSVEQLRATPHWIDRVAAGALPCSLKMELALTGDEQALVARRRQDIKRLRWERQDRRKVVPRTVHGTVRYRGLSVAVEIAPAWGVLPRRVTYACEGHAAPTRRGAVKAYLRARTIQMSDARPDATLRLHNGTWYLYVGSYIARVWRSGRPSRRSVRTAIEVYEATLADPHAPDTLGWREWHMRHGMLVSPVQRTVWATSCLAASEWDEEDVVEGRAGVHAYRCPRDWRIARLYRDDSPDHTVTGLVERHDRYVLGARGWRAERVRILGLVAPDAPTAALLAMKYPDVPEIIVRLPI